MARKKNSRQVELKPMPVTRKENCDGEEKYPLAKVIKKLPTRLDDTLIPKVYTPPTKEEIVVRARQEFYTCEEVSQSYCQVLESYKRNEAEEGPEQKQDPEQDSTILFFMMSLSLSSPASFLCSARALL